MVIVWAVLGGCLIGLAAAMALVGNGRVAGVSRALARSLDRDGGQSFRIPFLLGLASVGVVTLMIAPARIGPPIRDTGWLLLAGALVGYGTAISNGCTSGHGVCGIGRGSKRSLVAVIVFMATGVITVAFVGASS
ncbi:MAG: YeeE/YedE thiosulfate transporter family protein [Kofleriaceae bacterium]